MLSLLPGSHGAQEAAASVDGAAVREDPAEEARGAPGNELERELELPKSARVLLLSTPSR